MATLAERWAKHEEWIGECPDDAGESFALRGDGKLMIFDDEGWFLIVSTGPGPNPGAPSETVPDVLMLEDYKGNREAFYCEPIWLGGYWDWYIEQGWRDGDNE